MIRGFSTVSVAILLLTGVAAATSAVVYAAARRRRDTPASRPFARFALATAAWNGLAVATFLAPGRLAALVLRSLVAVVALWALVLWVEFVVYYTGNGDRLTRTTRALLWAEPVAYTVSEGYRLVDPAARAAETVRRFEGLTYVVVDAGGLQAFWTGYSMLLALASFGLLGWFVLRTRGGYRKQAATVFAGAFLTYLGAVGYYAFAAGPAEAFDPTPALNAVLAVVIAVALFRTDFLRTVPLTTDTLFASVPDPVVVLDGEDRVVDANPAAASLFEGPPVGRDLPTALPALAAALADGEDTSPVETGAGGERVFDLNVTALHDPYGRQRGRLVVLRDVTTQVARERELQRQNDRLDRFAGVVSHDLRNPLNVAYGFAERARDTEDLSQLDRSLSAMEDMEALIDDLLTLAREGESVDETEPVEFASVARTAWSFPEADATLVVESTGTVEADRGRLAELLGNCFRNAVEHAGDDVTVWVGTTGDGFYVEDDGPGIPEGERETVFESGYTTAETGTGLGLSIVAEIAGAHGWDVHADAGRSGGARIRVSGVDSMVEQSGASVADDAA